MLVSLRWSLSGPQSLEQARTFEDDGMQRLQDFLKVSVHLTVPFQRELFLGDNSSVDLMWHRVASARTGEKSREKEGSCAWVERKPCSVTPVSFGGLFGFGQSLPGLMVIDGPKWGNDAGAADGVPSRDNVKPTYGR